MRPQFIKIIAIIECDTDGSPVHIQQPRGFKIWKSYDSAGNEVHRRYLDGEEKWWEYDDKGKLVSYKYRGVNGAESITHYDSEGEDDGAFDDEDEGWFHICGWKKPASASSLPQSTTSRRKRCWSLLRKTKFQLMQEKNVLCESVNSTD